MKKCKDCKEEGCPFRCYTEEGKCSYEELSVNTFDWQSFRAEATKDILRAIINRESAFTRNGQMVVSHQDFIEIAVEDADALIAKLKEKEKK